MLHSRKGRSIVAFTETEVAVAEAEARPSGPGVWVPDLGYVRAETQDGQLLFALIDRSHTEVVSDLDVPSREVESGTVRIENFPVHGQGADADFLLLYDFERLIVVSGTAAGVYSTTGTGPGGVPVFVDEAGKLTYASFRYDAEDDWWTWLRETYGVWAYPSVVPPFLDTSPKAADRDDGPADGEEGRPRTGRFVHLGDAGPVDLPSRIRTEVGRSLQRGEGLLLDGHLDVHWADGKNEPRANVEAALVEAHSKLGAAGLNFTVLNPGPFEAWLSEHDIDWAWT